MYIQRDIGVQCDDLDFVEAGGYFYFEVGSFDTLLSIMSTEILKP